MTSLFRQNLDVLFENLDVAAVYPVPPSQISIFEAGGGTSTDVKGMFDSRDVVMTEGPVNVDDVAPVFSTLLSRLNAVGVTERKGSIVFGGVTYSIVRIIPRDPDFADCYLREHVTA